MTASQQCFTCAELAIAVIVDEDKKMVWTILHTFIRCISKAGSYILLIINGLCSGKANKLQNHF
ncbi:hypothetical protein ATO50_15160 [Aeromonas hydrophila]|nr:hypothetical protein ATO50_15160 [Aeromonas hydrophila]MBC6488269.1 hypothetical protein [Aeromonas hydrophila]